MELKVVAVNGSPRMEKGATHRLLTPFLEGLKKGGASTELFYIQKMNIRPCIGELKCWRETPGECFYKDDMQEIYEALRAADVLVLATPVYVPLPGAMQNFLNRIVPLLESSLEFRSGRTRAKLRDGVSFTKIVLVSTCGWLELENFDRVVHIVKELAETASIEFAGSLLRPHARRMNEKPDIVEEIFDAARDAGYQLTIEGSMATETLQAISRPVISQEEFMGKK